MARGREGGRNRQEEAKKTRRWWAAVKYWVGSFRTSVRSCVSSRFSQEYVQSGRRETEEGIPEIEEQTSSSIIFKLLNLCIVLYV